MPKNTAKRYFVRNKLHQTIGDFSEDEILSHIGQGKFSGEEEAALVPSLQWNRLSSYPVFYDALISRALGLGKAFSRLKTELENPATPSQQEISDEDTQGRRMTVAESPVEPNEATAQLPHPSPALSRVSNSEIAELFSNVNEQDASNENALLNQPLTELGEPPPENSSIPLEGDQTKSGKKRSVLWGGLAILLIVLFRLGDKKPEPNVTKEGTPAGPNREVEFVNSDSESVRIFLLKSADQALKLDSPPAYALAAEFYSKAIETNPSDLTLYDGITMALAKVIESKPEEKTILKRLERYLAQGRQFEPQRSAFFRAEAIATRAQGQLERAEGLLGLALETDSLSPENLLVQAEWFVQEEKFAEALPLLKSLVQTNPESTRATYLLGLTEMNHGNLDGAWLFAQKVTRLNPTHAATYSLMGDVLSKKNDLKAAKAVYLLSCKFAELANKKTASYAFWRAATLSEISGESKEKQRLYTLLFALASDYEQQALEKLSDRPGQDEIQQAKSEIYADAAYFDRLGTESLESKALERAQGFYLAATLVFPNSGRLWTRLGESREALARTKEEFRWAALTYEKAIQTNPLETEAYLKLGLLETEQSNWNRAFQALQKAEELAPEDALVQLSLGKHYFSRKDFREARERLRVARRTNPNLAEASYYQGLLYKIFDPQNPKAAIRYFEEAYSKDPTNYDALAEWLKLKVLTFEKMFAVKFLRNMVVSDSQNPMLLWVFGEVYSANKEFNRAIHYYQKALDLDRDSAKVRLSMARALAGLGRIDEAVSEFKLASDLDAKNGEGYFNAAELLYQTKNFSLSKELLQGLLQVVPNYPGARRLLAMSYQALNQPENAIKEMTLEARANPMNYQFAIELAELYMVNNKFVEATKELDAITNLPIEKTITDDRAPSGFKKEPTGLKAYRVRGLLLLSKCYRQLKRYEPADGAIQSALALEPENLDLKLERGFVLQSLGRYTEAAKDLNEFLSKNPNSPEAPAVKELLRTTVIEE